MLTEEPLRYVIRAGRTEYIFDRRHAQFTAISVDGKNLLAKPVEYNFFRAPVDNDVMRGDWYSAHLNDPIVKVYDTCALKKAGCVVIRAKQSFGWSIHQPFAVMDAEYRIDAEGGLDLQCSIETSNKVPFLPRRVSEELIISVMGLMRVILISIRLLISATSRQRSQRCMKITASLRRIHHTTDADMYRFPERTPALGFQTKEDFPSMRRNLRRRSWPERNIILSWRNADTT